MPTTKKKYIKLDKFTRLLIGLSCCKRKPNWYIYRDRQTEQSVRVSEKSERKVLDFAARIWFFFVMCFCASIWPDPGRLFYCSKTNSSDRQTGKFTQFLLTNTSFIDSFGDNFSKLDRIVEYRGGGNVVDHGLISILFSPLLFLISHKWSFAHLAYIHIRNRISLSIQTSNTPTLISINASLSFSVILFDKLLYIKHNITHSKHSIVKRPK